MCAVNGAISFFTAAAATRGVGSSLVARLRIRFCKLKAVTGSHVCVANYSSCAGFMFPV